MTDPNLLVPFPHLTPIILCYYPFICLPPFLLGKTSSGNLPKNSHANAQNVVAGSCSPARALLDPPTSSSPNCSSASTSTTIGTDTSSRAVSGRRLVTVAARCGARLRCGKADLWGAISQWYETDNYWPIIETVAGGGGRHFWNVGTQEPCLPMLEM